MESCLDWCKCCFWRFLLTSQNSLEWPQEENSGRLSKRCELEMAFLRSDYWCFASRVELSKIILLLPRKEHSGYTIIFDFNVYLKGAKICRREWYESNSKKASNDKGFSWWYFWRYLFSLIILFHLNNCFLLLNIDLGPTVGGVRISGCENQL